MFGTITAQLNSLVGHISLLLLLLQVTFTQLSNWFYMRDTCGHFAQPPSSGSKLYTRVRLVKKNFYVR